MVSTAASYSFTSDASRALVANFIAQPALMPGIARKRDAFLARRRERLGVAGMRQLSMGNWSNSTRTVNVVDSQKQVTSRRCQATVSSGWRIREFAPGTKLRQYRTSEGQSMHLSHCHWLVRIGRNTAAQTALFIAVILFIANLDALVDHVLHPEIPYFDQEHIVVGAVTAFVCAILFAKLCKDALDNNW